MKRFITGICLTLAFAATVATAGAQQVSIGFKGGMNAAKLGGDNIRHASSYTRMLGGAFMVIDFGKFVLFQPELLYAQKGTKMVDSDVSVKVKNDYVEMPLLARLQLPSSGSKFIPYGMLGPTIAFNAKCDLSGQIENSPVSMKCDDPDFGLVVKSVDYGMAFGAGAEAQVGRAFVGLDARYVLGLAKIDESDSAHDVKNRAFGVLLGVRFPLGGPITTASRSF